MRLATKKFYKALFQFVENCVVKVWVKPNVDIYVSDLQSNKITHFAVSTYESIVKKPPFIDINAQYEFRGFTLKDEVLLTNIFNEGYDTHVSLSDFLYLIKNNFIEVNFEYDPDLLDGDTIDHVDSIEQYLYFLGQN